ncbi:MAG: molecular chaperone [Deltaproteobacteria bacterium]|nr:molecular chaperone [Deltaproteobacteria bacterium]
MTPRGKSGVGLIALMVLAPLAARAGGLDIAPVNVELKPSETSGFVTLHNGGGDTLRFEVKLTVWTQGKDGQIVTEPSRALVWFPELFVLKPGESRHIRVGTTPEQFGEVEKTYRMFITELPAPAGAPGPQVRVLTQLGVPIFLAPKNGGQAKAELTAPQLEAGAVTFSLRNPGLVHLKTKRTTLEALGEGDAPLSQKSWDGWYVLAKGEREYREAVPKDLCAKVRKLQATVEIDGVAPLTATLPVPQGACAP